MHYFLWLIAALFLAGAFYTDATIGHDLAVLGWLCAAIGWGLAGLMAQQFSVALETWRQSPRQ